jgi:hypothetical protein
LNKQLEKFGFLAPGLCIFGDAAYMNNQYFASPFKSVLSGPRDAFNYYHSQLRIRIECAFGMLVNRWGLLRKALPSAIGIKKSCALVLCLCRLHNFCINERLRNKTSGSVILSALASDAMEILGGGGIPLETTANNEASPEQLLHGGHHHDDTSKQLRQQFRRALGAREQLPREKMLEIFINKGLQRPTPIRWQTKA